MGRIRKVKNAETLIQEYAWLATKILPKYFNNNHKLELEIGCGKGNFIIKKALDNPNTNYIGVERDSTIVLKILKKITQLAAKLDNLLIININANELNNWLKPETINQIYLNFSDPWPKKRHEKNRLTSNQFLNNYYSLLDKNGRIELKTDNDDFYQYSLESIQSFKKFKILKTTTDLYSNQQLLNTNVPTEYEQRFVSEGAKIKKIELMKN